MADALEHYLEQGALDAASRLVNAVERAISHIQRYPNSGSPRYAHALDLPGLLVWPCRRFPYLVFYLERSDHIDVWRVLHAQRDLPAWLAEDDG